MSPMLPTTLHLCESVHQNDGTLFISKIQSYTSRLMRQQPTQEVDLDVKKISAVIIVVQIVKILYFIPWSIFFTMTGTYIK